MSFFRAGLFTGRTAVVTGGGSGIGLAISHELMELGCNVVIASRNRERLAAAVSELNARAQQRASGDSVPSAWMFQCNVREEEQVRLL
jgi:peroxisomal trans-2-enoyl-CoA reductase